MDLKSIQKEYEKISDKLSKPEVFSNLKKFQELSRKHTELKEIVNLASDIENINKNIAENKEIIKEEDNQELVTLALEEFQSLKEEKETLEEKLKKLLQEKDSPKENFKNIIIEIRAGVGGEEAALFAGDLLRMYKRFAENQGWSVETLNSSKTGIGGYKEIIFEIEGVGAWEDLKYESGVHRVQRIPQTEKSGRIHTSTASVAVLPQPREIDIKIDPKDIKIETFRSSGPGGQHLNVTDSAIRLTHLSTGLVVSCQEERSQHKNKAKALKILKARLLAKKIKNEEKKRATLRRSQIGKAFRSEKIRTYNFPQDRITDHRLKKSWKNLEDFMDGDIEKIVKTLKEKLK